MKRVRGLEYILRETTPSRSLYQAILLRIAELERRAARIQAVVLGIVAVISCAALVPALQYAAQEFWASGFYDYVSLFFSDRSLVMLSWQEFLYSLVESIPSIAILLLVAVGGLLVWSLRRALRNARTGFAPLSLHA